MRPKSIVVFSDGTGNSAAQLFKTNVWRTYQSLDLSSPDQVAEYDDGVGTSSFRPYAILGGALGVGLARNVRHLYAFICRNYEPGDRIYAFGFSRGAFTIRILGQLIVDQGLLPPTMSESERQRFTSAAYRAFRRTYTMKASLVPLFRSLRDRIIAALEHRRGQLSYDDIKETPEALALKETPIHFLGLWDTVDAYGLPIDEMTRAWDLWFWPLSMRRRVLHERVERACHALAIDDERNTFHPLLWDENSELQNATSTHVDQERVTQVWFSGMHANVGGGYADDSMSSVPLAWMLEQATQAGLRLAPGALQEVQNQAEAALRFKRTALDTARRDVTPFGRMYDSRQGMGSYYRYLPRKILALCNDFTEKTLPVRVARPKIHYSVFERIKYGGDHYAPLVIPEHYAVVAADGTITQETYEKASDARIREGQQERVWNLVWKRRLVYFANVAASIAFALLPWALTSQPDGSCNGSLCFLSPVVGAAGTVLPMFAKPWIEAYRSNPSYVLLAALVLGTLAGVSRSLRGRTDDQMRWHWSHVWGRGSARTADWSWADSIIFRMRMAWWYRDFFWLLKRWILPLFFVAVFAAAGAILATRVLFAGASSFGFVCRGSAGAPPELSAGNLVTLHDFPAAARCWPSGIRLTEGARYRIQLSLPPSGTWGHRDHPVPFTGYEATGTWSHLWLPLRRQLGQDWLKPIARIGVKGEDEYPLDPLVGGSTTETTAPLVSEFTARTTGELFLYVNGGVPPRLWNWFYGPNVGTADVVIRRLTPPPIEDSGR